MLVRFWLLVCVLLPVSMACSPGGLGPGASPSGQGQPTVPKTLTVGILREPATIDGFTGEGGSRGGAGEAAVFLHSLLTVEDPYDQELPQLAAELPSVDAGTWRLNPDGSMDVTWKLVANARWHDGTPFTADDVLFSLALHKDPDLAHAYTAQARIMQSAT